MKRCTKCGKRKSTAEFSKHRITKDGLSHVCKLCDSKKWKQYTQTPSGIYTAIRARVRYYKNKIFKITREEFVKWYVSIEKRCAYCDVREEDLRRLGDTYNNKAHRLTVDCIENKKGYIAGNLVLACLRCNSIKSDLFSHKEMRGLSQEFIRPKWEARLSE